MARLFNGTTDGIDMAGWAGTLTANAFSLFAVVKVTSLAVNGKILCVDAGGVKALGLVNSDGTLEWYDGANGRTAPTTKLVAGEWYIVGFSKATGTVTGRFHFYRYSTATWTHENASGTSVNFSGVAGGNGGFSLGADLNETQNASITIDAAAVYLSELTDANFVRAGRSQADMLAVATPQAAWRLDQASIATPVPALVGISSQASIVGTTVAAASLFPYIRRYYFRTTIANKGTLAASPTGSVAIPAAGETNPDVAGGPFDLSFSPGTATGRQGPPGASQTAAQDVLVAKFVSPVLDAGDFASATAWAFALAVSNSDAAATSKVVCSIYILKNDNTVRGFIYDSHTQLGATVPSGDGFHPTGRLFTLSGVGVAGVLSTDKLVIEVWFHTTQSSAIAINYRFEFDGAVLPTEGLDTGNDARSYVEWDNSSITLDTVLPDADVTTTGWTTTPLFSKVNDASDATVIQATAV